MRLQVHHSARLLLPAVAILLIEGATVAQQGTTSAGLGGWRIAGRDLNNSRNQPAERQIGPSNVNRLVQKWVFTAGSDVSATPTVAGNSVYFPDWAGNLFALRADTGQLLWTRKISEYNGRPGSMSRVSPAIYEDQLIIGDNMSTSVTHNGAHVMAIDRNSGALRRAFSRATMRDTALFER
ncbi:MAG TPA: PQQ-binding-like beta-propeller repeat protein [Vicinamibacterales bacterium]|nr:PQQ-binding-like beta-propeller repeat protein [Vicinamibacterales bacterium]